MGEDEGRFIGSCIRTDFSVARFSVAPPLFFRPVGLRGLHVPALAEGRCRALVGICRLS